MNKYHDGEFSRWVDRMTGAGWRWWLFVEPGIMWRHADAYKATINLSEAQDYFKQYVNTGGVFIPDPYEVMEQP